MNPFLLTFEQFKEYISATSVKQLYSLKDNIMCSINSLKHSQNYKSASFENVFDKFMDPSLNAREGFKYQTNYKLK